MSFIEWIYSSYPNPHVDGQWGTLHIITLALCIALIVASSLLLKNKSEKSKRAFLWVLAVVIIFF